MRANRLAAAEDGTVTRQLRALAKAFLTKHRADCCTDGAAPPSPARYIIEHILPSQCLPCVARERARAAKRRCTNARRRPTAPNCSLRHTTRQRERRLCVCVRRRPAPVRRRGVGKHINHAHARTAGARCRRGVCKEQGRTAGDAASDDREAPRQNIQATESKARRRRTRVPCCHTPSW